jgi:hypothetical protein
MTTAKSNPIKTSQVKTKAAAKPSKATGGVTNTAPSLRFYHTEVLRAQTDTVLHALDTKPGDAENGEALSNLVAELVEAGMDYYFLRALKLAEVGFLVEQSAKLGMSGAVKVINSLSRKFILRMDASQLSAIGAHIRSLA